MHEKIFRDKHCLLRNSCGYCYHLQDDNDLQSIAYTMSSREFHEKLITWFVLCLHVNFTRCYSSDWNKHRYLMPEGITARLSLYSKFTGTWSPHMHHITVSSPSCLGTRPGKRHDKIQKLEYNIIFVHDLWKSLLIPAMIIPATLIINMGTFTTLHIFFVVIEFVIQFINAFMQLFCHPCHP